MLVLALHTAYLVALFTGSMPVREQMLLALAAYAAYAINATQFLLKLRAARLQAEAEAAGLESAPELADQPSSVQPSRGVTA
jgi:3-vinyl bacteriochlorophyllide hydratase